MNDEEKIFDLAILGGGPAGVAAGVYAARKKLKTVLITKDFGGQSVVSENIENWIGEKSISGAELAKKLEEHITHFHSEEDQFIIKKAELIISVEKEEGEEVGLFLIKTDRGRYRTKTVLVSTGSKRKKIDVPGAEKFEHKGLTYCASCDGPFYRNKNVVVIGGGNAGFESAAQLLNYAKSVTLLQRSDKYKADATTVEKVLNDPKMTGILNAKIKEIRGDKFLDSIIYEKDGEEIELKIDGIFVEIGSIPAVDFLRDLVSKTQYGQIIVDPRTQKTSDPAIWAAGDCTDGLYHQNTIAMGDAIKALENIYLYLKG